MSVSPSSSAASACAASSDPNARQTALGKRPARPGRFKLDDLVVHRLAVRADPGIAHYRTHVLLFRISFSKRRVLSTISRILSEARVVRRVTAAKYAHQGGTLPLRDLLDTRGPREGGLGWRPG
jgi:hypothetical protein